MILTCPECATSYFVDDARIPDAGRTVKCSSCGARWLAMKEPEPPPEPEAEVLEAEPESDPTPGAPEEIEVVPVEPPAARSPSPGRPAPRKEAARKVLVLAGAAAAVAALIGGLIVLREQVVHLWPGSSPAYAGLGLPVDTLGLVVEEVRFEPAFQGGRPVLSVTGAIRNVKDQAQIAPPLRISLLDRDGEPVAAKIARPIDGRIPGGAKRYFALSIVDPPANAHALEVRFEKAAAEPAGAGRADAAAARG